MENQQWVISDNRFAFPWATTDLIENVKDYLKQRFFDEDNPLSPLLTVADFDGNGVVERSDLQDLSARYRSQLGDDNYHPLYDLNADEKIDGRDIALAMLSLGEEVPLLDQQIAQATQATMRYYGPDGLKNALADGYLPFTQELNGHGFHYYNYALAEQINNSLELDPTKPVGLNYDDQGNLLAVFYLRMADRQEPTPDNPFAGLLVEPADDFPPSVSFDTLTNSDWHHHDSAWLRNLGSLDPKQVYFEEDVPLSLVISRLQDEQFQLFPDSEQGYSPKFWMLHGWFHFLNPNGTFAITNPRVSPYAPSELGVHGEHHNMSLKLFLGTDEKDTLTGTPEAERFNGFDQDDKIFALAGDDLIWGGFGNDLIYGGQGNDMIYAGPDDDLLYGGLGDDRLFGSLGDDQIWGGEGDDLLRGGLGNDILRGDKLSNQYLGKDVFVLVPDEGIDRIEDFQLEFDKIVLEGGLNQQMLSIVQNGSDTWLNLLSNQTTIAILTGINADELINSSPFIVA